MLSGSVPLTVSGCSFTFTATQGFILAMCMQKAVALLHDTEQVVRTFQRTHRWRQAGKVCLHSLWAIMLSSCIVCCTAWIRNAAGTRG